MFDAILLFILTYDLWYLMSKTSVINFHFRNSWLIYRKLGFMVDWINSGTLSSSLFMYSYFSLLNLCNLRHIDL